MASASFETLVEKFASVVELIYSQYNQPSTPQTRQDLLRVINEFKDDVARAQEAAHALHGGHLTSEEQDDIIQMLMDIKEQKKKALESLLARIDLPPPVDTTTMEIDSTASTPTATFSIGSSASSYVYPGAHDFNHLYPLFDTPPHGMAVPRPTFVLLALSLFSTKAFADLNATSWSSPAEGDIYESSQAIQCVLQSSSLLNAPGFRLCVVPQDGGDTEEDAEKEESRCGALIFPEVEQEGTTYSAQMAMPSVDRELQCYVKVEDNAGDITSSPMFLLTAVKPIRGQSFAAIPPSDASPVTDESSSPLPSRIIIYAIPLAFLGITILTGLSVYLYRRRRANRPIVAVGYSSKDRDLCHDDKCGDPIACAHSRSNSQRSYSEKTDASSANDDHYTALYTRSLAYNHPRLQQNQPRQPRQATKEPFRPRPRRSTVPARFFKDGSIRSQSSVASEEYAASHADQVGPIPAAMTYDVIANQYLQPAASTHAVAAEAVTPPKRLHTRKRGASSTSQGLGRRVTHGYSGSV
ncbi:hypothetical protein EIP91_010397 [Steccherinum ochraceum]|uniref:Mediator complex subunit 9 n=1 Tax=Steccherinum ochraceum TaxID=92696 RepID=A0A4R0RLZ0_9APHY|nr:hypothetical protein EIP91_010397 [Steccherinum ochraceum]